MQITRDKVHREYGMKEYNNLIKNLYNTNIAIRIRRIHNKGI